MTESQTASLAIDGRAFSLWQPDRSCMTSSPKKQLIDPSHVMGIREIPFRDRGEPRHPQLMRLCAGFDFHVLQIQRKVFSHLSCKMVPGAHEFVLAIRDEQKACWYSLTPETESLAALEKYCKAHEIDLLHLHLCGDEDTEVFLQAAFF